MKNSKMRRPMSELSKAAETRGQQLRHERKRVLRRYPSLEGVWRPIENLRRADRMTEATCDPQARQAASWRRRLRGAHLSNRAARALCPWRWCGRWPGQGAWPCTPPRPLWCGLVLERWSVRVSKTMRVSKTTKTALLPMEICRVSNVVHRS